ncbi:MAG: hypothetical protein LKF79_03945 [Solobacterium sp.]|jgi:uncharacterized protein YcfL|nr:hypothetical protein [Solobacterium sp.]MCH4222079.1 hypothetical protein [Solobacterium sp.]MCH4265778.1 hypothetical protein [Solobacterium sp.]
MLKHEFSAREKALLIICAALALGIFYYLFAYSGFKSAEQKYDTTDLEDQLMIEEAKSGSITKMQTEIDAAQGQNSGEIAVYNNQSNEIQALNDILSTRATEISITWNQPTVTGVTVRRDASISFRTTGYNTARSILNDLSGCKYRLIMNDISIDSGGSDSQLSSSSSISVSVTVTFFETTDGATTTQGLVDMNGSTSTEG